MFQKKLKSFRIAIALIVIIGELVLFADVKGKLPSGLYTILHELQFIPSIIRLITPGTLFSFGFIIILLLTLFSGRVYCSFFCPLGIIQDISGWIRQKIKPKKKNRFMKALNWIRYSVLALVVISLVFTGLLLVNLLDPYAIFGRIASNIYQPLLISLNNLLAGALNSAGSYLFMPVEPKVTHLFALFIALFFLLLVIVFSVFKGRLYCNTVCPVGAFLGLLSKISLYKIRINSVSCTKCGKCQIACKANCIDIKTLNIDETRCVDCYNCIPVCESDSIGYKLTLAPGTPEQTNVGKRGFIKASAFYILAIPGVSGIFKRIQSEEDERGKGGGYGYGRGQGHGKYGRHFWDRGVASPPGSLGIERFKDKCVACHLCVSVCPTKVLQPSYLDYGLTGMLIPKMSYNIGFCNYECTKCGEVCPTGAILELPKEEKKLVQIGEVAFTQHLCIVETEGTACGSCSEHCPTQAVRMVPYIDDLTIPEIDPSICIGCGACEYACPVTEPHKAIFVMPNDEHIIAEAPKQEALDVEETEDFPF